MAKKNNDNSDFMSRRQDEQLEQLEERLTALYANAENEIRAKWSDFTAGFEKDDEAKRKQVEAGTLPEDEYTAWRKTQILKSNQYSKAVESMTNILVETDEAAMATVNGQLPQVVAESYDFVQALGFKAADTAGINTGTFQIYNARTVQALIKDNPDLMPAPKVNIPEDKRWNKDRINREITQGIVQGESIPKIAHRLQRVTTMDRNAAVRNARTAMTGAENLGRYESAQDLRENGIPVEEVWSATYDNRTRESHLLLDGTKRDESGYFGVGIINTPLRFAGDPTGDPEEVYNCRCRTGIVLQGIDHSKDQDLYEEFMKQFEDGRDMLEGKEPEAESQHQEPEQKMEKEIKAPEQIATPRDMPELKDLEPAELLTSGSREIVQGEDLTENWVRDRDKYQFEIDNAVAAQGFNGLPRVVGEEEFNKAVEESGFIAQRTYSAPDQETLDAYRDQLYNGDWYVNCSTGGAQYGQGMYCAANYNGELTDGIKEEMEHYRTLGEERYNQRMTDEERVEAARSKLPEDIANNGTAIEYLKALQSGSLSEQAKYFSMLDSETERAVSKALSETPLDTKAKNYVETLTLTPDAKIITYEEASKMFDEFKDTHHFDYEGYMREAKQAYYKEMNLSNRERADYITMVNLWNGPSSAANTQRREALEQKYGITADEIDKKIREKYKEIAKDDIKDIGSFCALKGYDAINSEGHGASDSYTVILNRTKVIFKREEP